jgi:hypothetical protein
MAKVSSAELLGNETGMGLVRDSTGIYAIIANRNNEFGNEVH